MRNSNSRPLAPSSIALAVATTAAMLLGFCGCASVIPASESQKGLAASPPQSGRAKLCVFRIKAFAGSIVKAPVLLDGRVLGYNTSGSFIVTEVMPGNHTISTGVSASSFNAKAQETYYFRQTPTFSWTGQEANITLIEPASPSDGQAAIRGAEQAASLF